MPEQSGGDAGTAATSGAGATWTNPNNAKILNGSNALSADGGTADSKLLRLSNFGFTIPNNATVTGVLITLSRYKSTGTFIKDKAVQLLVAGSETGTNKADTSTNWPATLAARLYGGALDRWGNTLTPAIINASNFGASLSISIDADIGYVDAIQVTVYWLPEQIPPLGLSKRISRKTFRKMARRVGLT